MDALKLIAQDSLKAEAPKFNVGDTVKVHVRIAEGDKFRIQIFEGTVIAKKHGGVSETFTVRRVAHGCGIERVFPLHSPTVERLRSLEKVRYAELSSIIFVTELVRQLRLSPRYKTLHHFLIEFSRQWHIATA